MSASNPFLLDVNDYGRRLDFFNEAVEQAALFLSKTENISLEEAKQFVIKTTKPDGAKPRLERKVKYHERNKFGDRVVKEGLLIDYLGMVEKRKSPMPPTMTAYIPFTEEPSILGEYIEGNVNIRSSYKAIKFEAQQKGNQALVDEADGIQNSKKTLNNSLSGAHSSEGTPLFNRSAHSTLTSGCRITTAYGNANNEKFLAGNRHYWSAAVTIENIITIVRHGDYHSLQKAITEFDLHLPSVEETMACILRSSSPYWRNELDRNTIRQLVANLQPIERAMFLYSGDLFHLAKYNDSVVRSFLRDLTVVTTVPIPLEEAKLWMKQASKDEHVFNNLLCAEWTADKNIKDILKETPDIYCIIASNVKNVVETLGKYRVLIEGVMRPATLHGSIAHLPSIIRRAVLASDTDSTIFTNQHWVEWYTGKLDFSTQSYRIGYATTFLTSQVVIHLLAMMSAQIGLAKVHLNGLEMKNEYYFPVFTLTSRAKHYFANKSAQEGNVFKKMKQEIKGVELRSSNAPKEINDKLHAMMNNIMETLMAGEKLYLKKLLSDINAIETAIIADINRGSPHYLRNMPLKDGSSYVAGEDAPALFYHRMWKTVFEPKYGPAPDLPYQGVKVSVNIDNPTKFKEYIASIPDKAMAERLENFCKENQRTSLTVMVFPRPVVEMTGIPDEVRPIVEYRKLVHSIMAPYYLFLESFGIYMTNKKFSRMIHDYLPVN